MSAFIFAPLVLLGALRLPAYLHRTLLFQRSFIDLDRRGTIIYSIAIAVAALLAAFLAF